MPAAARHRAPHAGRLGYRPGPAAAGCPGGTRSATPDTHYRWRKESRPLLRRLAGRDGRVALGDTGPVLQIAAGGLGQLADGRVAALQAGRDRTAVEAGDPTAGTRRAGHPRPDGRRRQERHGPAARTTTDPAGTGSDRRAGAGRRAERAGRPNADPAGARRAGRPPTDQTLQPGRERGLRAERLTGDRIDEPAAGVDLPAGRRVDQVPA